jgi:hypothetical protein
MLNSWLVGWAHSEMLIKPYSAQCNWWCTVPETYFYKIRIGSDVADISVAFGIVITALQLWVMGYSLPQCIHNRPPFRHEIFCMEKYMAHALNNFIQRISYKCKWIENEICIKLSNSSVARWTTVSLFPVAPTLEHRASVKRFVSLQFLNSKTVGRTPWMGGQPVGRTLPIRTQNKQRQASMSWVGFEITIPAFKRAKTILALDCAATVTGPVGNCVCKFFFGTSLRPTLSLRLCWECAHVCECHVIAVRCNGLALVQ